MPNYCYFLDLSFMCNSEYFRDRNKVKLKNPYWHLFPCKSCWGGGGGGGNGGFFQSRTGRGLICIHVKYHRQCAVDLADQVPYVQTPAVD